MSRRVDTTAVDPKGSGRTRSYVAADVARLQEAEQAGLPAPARGGRQAHRGADVSTPAAGSPTGRRNARSPPRSPRCAAPGRQSLCPWSDRSPPASEAPDRVVPGARRRAWPTLRPGCGRFTETPRIVLRRSGAQLLKVLVAGADVSFDYLREKVAAQVRSLAPQCRDRFLVGRIRVGLTDR